MRSSEADQKKWTEVIHSAYSSGIGVKPWCSAHQISEKQFYYWRKKLSLQPEKSANDARLVEIQPPVDKGEEEEAILEYGGFRFVIHKQASQETIEKVIRAMRNA